MVVDPSLRVKNVYVLLGNYTMGGIVYPRHAVTNSPEPDDFSVNFPVTRCFTPMFTHESLRR